MVISLLACSEFACHPFLVHMHSERVEGTLLLLRTHTHTLQYDSAKIRWIADAMFWLKNLQSWRVGLKGEVLLVSPTGSSR